MATLAAPLAGQAGATTPLSCRVRGPGMLGVGRDTQCCGSDVVWAARLSADLRCVRCASAVRRPPAHCHARGVAGLGGRAMVFQRLGPPLGHGYVRRWLRGWRRMPDLSAEWCAPAMLCVAQTVWRECASQPLPPPDGVATDTAPRRCGCALVLSRRPPWRRQPERPPSKRGVPHPARVHYTRNHDTAALAAVRQCVAGPHAMVAPIKHAPRAHPS